jgi:predicted Zn finger-like uncharacterized protein
MYTRCPHCEAVFQVTTSELTAYDGNVRCGECGRVFNGLDTLSVLPPEGVAPPSREWPRVKQVPEQTEREAPAPAPRGEAPTAAAPQPSTAKAPAPVTQPVTAEAHVPDTQSKPVIPEATPPLEPAPAPAPASGQAPEPEPGPTTAGVPVQTTGQVPLVIRDAVVSAPPADRRRHLLATLGLGVLSLGLIGLLAGQSVYHERDRLAAYPEMVPMLQWMCNRLDCVLPPRRDPDAFQLSSRNVYSHPNVEGALMVQAVLSNQADFAQPYPLVELSFRDLQGELLAVRRFVPEEYLQRAPTEASVAPGAPIHLHLEIEDPGPRAVAYEFRFL